MQEKSLVGKDELTKRLQECIEKVTGQKLPLTDVWNIFKLCIYLPFDMANLEDKRISIPKIGVMTTSKILEAYKVNGKVRPKFYGSSGMEKVMTEGKSLVDLVINAYTSKYEGDDIVEEPKKETKKAEVKKEEPKKETKKAEPKKETKKAEPKKETKKPEPKKVVKEEVEELPDVDDTADGDDFDFDFI